MMEGHILLLEKLYIGVNLPQVHMAGKKLSLFIFLLV